MMHNLGSHKKQIKSRERSPKKSLKSREETPRKSIQSRTATPTQETEANTSSATEISEVKTEQMEVDSGRYLLSFPYIFKRSFSWTSRRKFSDDIIYRQNQFLHSNIVLKSL